MPENSSLALLVRNPPYRQRSARAQLDVALAALAMDFRLEVYFIGSAVMQLLRGRDSEPAMLPAAYRAWATLPDLGEFSLFAEQGWLERLPEPQFRLIMPVHGLDTVRMQENWRRCDYSLNL